MAAPVQKGNEILIPLFDGAALGQPITVKWQQDFSQRQEGYYQLIADNLATGTTFPLFIAAEFYKSSTSANPNHISKIAELLPGEGYKITVDERFQYGQKNVEGENRFLILHDKGRKPYQHRFIETAVASALARQGEGVADKVCGAFGLPAGSASKVTDTVKCYIGDYLRTF
ncbi:hypothetical protein QBC33DRAFT_564719 [Phialemonium atrogriseum]|uniref:Uncharacterized protein n=1 Tax=Phialemonium atrogriseum TaxID=1093897 RepID=A0AAJ0C8R3_9PEZI|nr:uncharacterized protein QBC33DRAFT_564719 [Phialemonium atrogriseum]KAK1772239.1 hypothetical protein QBC33DRAFT_564719 [Phialemonium atrogriseum]